MNIYPLKQINRDLWEKKVNSTSMFTIPAEDEALPVLHELDQILTRLMTLPILETLSQDLIPYFFTAVFPPVCQKIIKSRYFKNTQVLKISNSILQKSVYLIPKYLELAIKNPKSFSILINVFSDEAYFKTNNQLNYMIYPYSYFLPNKKQFEAKIGDLVDIIKIGNLYQKVTWSQGKIIAVSQQEYQVKYLFDGNDKKTIVSKKSHQIAPFNSKSRTFQWRKSLKAGDLVDVEDSYGSWYNGTVLQVIQKEQGKKNLKVTLKVYNENGNRLDQRGYYFGLTQNQETFDFTSPKIAPYCTIAKQFCYETGKMMSYDSVDDINDYQFPQMNGNKIYAFPRKKNLSQFQFQTINVFGQLGGFDKILQYLQSQVNFDVFCSFVKGISGVAPYLHRQLVKTLVERIKRLLQKYLFNNQEKTTKYFTKQLSQIIYSGIKTLLKRLYTHDNATKYTNQIKMRLVDICLQSQSLKSKLQGLNQLKDVVKSVSYLSDRYKYVKQWVKINNIFEKIYIVNSHVQLIKKSEEFFKYLITQNILQVNDLQKLYRMAQKGDFESRVSIYKLFQQVSHNFKKQHGQFLIDTILESELHLVLNQDIDLLHQLSRFSNYYPLQKVFKFFQNIILGDNKTKQLNDYATKKYSQIVAKNSDAKPYRQAIIKKFIQKLQTYEISKIIKILKGIFEGMAIGQIGKKQLNQVICQQKLDEVLINVLRKSKGQNQFNRNLTLVLDFLLFIYKLSYKIVININILTSIWQVTSNQQGQMQFYRWANQICKCQQGIETPNIQQLEKFCRKIFSSQIIPSMNGVQFELAKNIFVQINKRIRSISVSNVFKDRDVQKQYKRKTQMNELKLIDLLIQMIYKIKEEGINNQALSFFIQLYNSKPNSQRQIDEFLNQLLNNFKEEYEAKNYNMLVQTIKLMEIVINDSQKNVQTNIKSLISKKQPDYAKFIIINQCNSFITDSMKKSELVLPMNMPIIKVRKLMAKQFKLNWQQIKIVSNKEIQDHENSRTIKQIKLNPSQPLTVSRRIIQSQTEQDLIINDSMNPKAVRCFKAIFDNYSTDGKMNKNQCNDFTAVCLGSSGHVRYEQKITSLYRKYDDDHDDLLTFQNFIKFYEDAAKDRAHTVWSNLKSFRVRGNFKFPHQPDQDYEVQKYPRYVIAQYPKVYEILFDLLHIKEVASVAFELLERLPVSSALQNQLLNIQSKENLQKILDVQDLYKLFYRLNLIQYLAHSKELQTQVQKGWHKKFIQLEGYELLYDCIEKISLKFKKQEPNEEQFNQIIRQISETGLNLLNQYWLQCFSKNGQKLRTSLAFISCEQDIDDKMDYLLFDRFIKHQKKIEPAKSKIPSSQQIYNWKGKQRQQIKRFLLEQLESKWLQVCKIKYSEPTQKKYNITMLLFKIIDALNILFMNENPQNLAQITSNLFDQNFTNQLIRRFYCLILSLCFYSQTKYQGILIRELFKNLTKRTITSEHFRVLAVLVSKFGIQNSGDQGQSTQMLTSVLLDNVLNNKNELTIEGCAKLLTNFYLKGIQYEVFERIWNERLFNPDTICQKDQSRSAIYGLILKLCDHNPGLIQKISKKVIGTLQKEAGNMKITYCNEYKQRSATGYAGLKNLGNTCYINSMIQQLYMNRNFRYCILRADDKQQPNLIETIDNKNQVRTVDDNFLHQVQRIFANLQLTTRIDYAPRDFCVAYKPFGQSVNILIQQDVQQFISMFFDRLESGLSKTMFKKLVQDFYTGKTVNLFKCHSCSKTKKVEQSFYSISLQVKTSKTLAQSFNRFCHGEMINDYKCDFCNNKVDVTKKTRISKIPKTLIIHLQRIVFNLDTFINQKISTKHSFPHSYNLHQATLDFYERSEAGQTDIQEPKEYNYNLIGIICHSGTAQSGHYICYIKTNQNKWVQFNDSQVTSFSPSNIQSECFGGSFSMASAYDEQYFDQKKQSSKSAYLLVYEKEGADTIELILKHQLQNCKTQKQRQKLKQKLLQSLDLKQIIQKLENDQNKESKPNKQRQKTLQMSQNTPSKVNQDKEESSSAPEDSQKQTKKLLEAKQLEIKRHQSQDNIQTEITELNKQSSKEQKPNVQQMTVLIQQPVNPYIPQNLRQQIVNDNITHFMEKCLSSPSFVKFFSQLISLPNNFYSQLLSLCKKLTFGFWLKSPSFKDLLSMLDDILKRYPQGFEEIVTNNPAIINLLIQSSDSDVRTCMANFLAKVIADTIQSKGININDNKDDPIFIFLDKLFSLLPSTVSRCWTKFGQYFQFWYQLSTKGEVLVEYMINRELIKHFMDYFLDTKSPLKIYVNKRQHQIGSSYANPNFSMLLKCVFSLLQHRMIMKDKLKEKMINSEQEQILLMSHDSLQKLIVDKYQNIAAQLVKEICPHNLQASQKAAVVLLKGITRSSSQTVQPYLEVLHQFALIEDQYQDLRIEWVIGRQTLAVSTLSLKIIAMNSYSLQERIHHFQPTLQVQNGSSVLQLIIIYHKRIQTYAMLCTRQILRLCDERKNIRKLIFNLQSPTLLLTKYTDFFKGFIDKYIEDQKRSYGFYSSTTGFNREQFSKQVKILYEKVMVKVRQDQKQSKEVENKVEQKNQGEKEKEIIRQNQVTIGNKQNQSEKDFGKQQNYNNSLNDKQNDQNIDSLPELKENSRQNSLQQVESSKFTTSDEVLSQNIMQIQLKNLNQNPQHVINQSQQQIQQPLLKQRKQYKSTTVNKPKQKQINKDYKQTWHPIKFQYKSIRNNHQLAEQFPNFYLEEHESIVTYLLTKPTGSTNRSFTNKGGVQKSLQRLLQETWQNSKQVKVHGFYAKNYSKQTFRIQTNEGCVQCKGGQNSFIWADQIIKVWVAQKSGEWPKWKLFDKSNKKQK